MTSIQRDPVTGQVYANFTFTGSGRVQMEQMGTQTSANLNQQELMSSDQTGNNMSIPTSNGQNAQNYQSMQHQGYDGLKIHDKYIEESELKKEKTIVLEVDQRKHMADLVGKIPAEDKVIEKRLSGALITGYITEEELKVQSKQIEASMRQMLSEKYGTVKSFMLVHKQIPDANNLSNRKKYALVYEATVESRNSTRGEAQLDLNLEEFEVELKSLIENNHPSFSIVTGSTKVAEIAISGDTQEAVSDQVMKTTGSFNSDSTDIIAQLDSIAQKSSEQAKFAAPEITTFGGSFISEPVKKEALPKLKQGFDQLVHYIFQKSIPGCKISTSIAKRPVFRSKVGDKWALSYIIEVRVRHDKTMTSDYDKTRQDNDSRF